MGPTSVARCAWYRRLVMINYFKLYFTLTMALSSYALVDRTLDMYSPLLDRYLPFIGVVTYWGLIVGGLAFLVSLLWRKE